MTQTIIRLQKIYLEPQKWKTTCHFNPATSHHSVVFIRYEPKQWYNGCENSTVNQIVTHPHTTRFRSHITKFQTRNVKQVLIIDAQKQKTYSAKDDLLCRKQYNAIDEVNHLQILLPEKLLKVLLQSPHGTARKYPGFSKMLPESGQRY